MRIFAVGVGGAGCRIVDLLYEHDRRSGSVHCAKTLAIDTDIGTLSRLSNIPSANRLHFPALDPFRPDDDLGHISVDEVMARLSSMDSGNLDAILIFCGLGGMLAGIIPELVKEIRQAMVEPVFGVFVLPSPDEGSEKSARAADAIDILVQLLDGVILFDNQIWTRKAEDAFTRAARKGARRIQHILKPGKARQESSRSGEELYRMINTAIARRIGILLRAGEYSEGSGFETGEVVLDAGEVLNTIRGMGFITIGYAAERIRSKNYIFRRILRHSDYRIEKSHKKASLVVEIAKRAVNEEMSASCDFTTAHKALILIAGPSHELNMKGFMAVRNWIDKSIRGLEVRSGDYPIRSTGHIAIVIVLAGLTHIPRINEIRDIRDQAASG